MRTIWEAIRDGNGKERLAVIADLVQIVGVSLVSIIASAFAVEGRLDPNAIFGLAIVGLLSLAGAAMVLALFLVVSSYIGALLAGHKTLRNLMWLAWWSAFTALVLFACALAYELLTHLRFTSG